MAREIVKWCDVHLANDEKVLAETVTVAFYNQPAVEIDLCDVCRKEIVDPLVRLLSEHGAPPDTSNQPGKRARKMKAEEAVIRRSSFNADGTRKGMPPTRARSLICLWCELDYAAESGLTRHIEKAHVPFDSNLSGRELYGIQCPLCGDNYQHIAGHATKAHSDLGPFHHYSQVFLKARELGDPFGIVANTVKIGRT